MSSFSDRARVRRNAARGVYDLEKITAILDSNQVCHAAYVEAGEPRIIPTLYMRRGDHVYLHGNRQAALLRHLGGGGLGCISVMSVEGVVVARSGFHCSMNYHSVVLFGYGEIVPADEHEAVLNAFVQALVPGHERQVRRPTEQELSATTAVRVRIDEASAKIRTGPPIDDVMDLNSAVWAGVIPLATQALEPIAAPNLSDEIDVPAYIREYGDPR
ncbi:MAG: pyridoxamine 5'-phosphate oxidase family protein [Gammaproteobacteria bacterium]|nr:pyridoxamine 5'-phosphate oxidase family protein [Gammaproteobacteria bacterium]